MVEAAREFVLALEDLMVRFQEEHRFAARNRKLTPLQFVVLKIVSSCRGVTMSGLATKLGVKPQTVTHIVDSLEQSGQLRRADSSEDRRRTILLLTPRGRRTIDSVHSDFVRRLESILSVAPESKLRAAAEAVRIAEKAYARDHPRREA